MNSSERLRYIVLGSLVGAVFLFFVGQMMVLQLRDGEEYARQATAGTSTVQQTTSARGEIVDAYGKATVEAYGSATVEALGRAKVTAYDSATVDAYDSAIVVYPYKNKIVYPAGWTVETHD